MILKNKSTKAQHSVCSIRVSEAGVGRQLQSNVLMIDSNEP